MIAATEQSTTMILLGFAGWILVVPATVAFLAWWLYTFALPALQTLVCVVDDRVRSDR